MKFDDDLVGEVKMQAPRGVEFEDGEVEAALVRAVNGIPFPFFVTAVERAAVQAIRRRRGVADLLQDHMTRLGDQHDPVRLVHAHWPRYEAERGACGAWARKQDDGLDDSSGYVDTTCLACIERLADIGVPSVNVEQMMLRVARATETAP